MEVNLQTPALLFPAISLLMLAYTNRFLALASLIRSLHAAYRSAPDERLLAQIRSLRARVLMIRNMQFLGVSSILLCVIAMFLFYEQQAAAARLVFGAGMVALIGSLLYSLREIHISVHALNLQLADLERDEKRLPPLLGEQPNGTAERGAAERGERI